MISYLDLSKTVYSLVWPETKNIMRSCFAAHTEEMLSRHDATHTKVQDAIGPDFAREWWAWAGVNKASPDTWSHFYPTNGASEALREIINELSRDHGTLIVFEGEYEGYAAIASGAGINVVYLDRKNWCEEWERVSGFIGAHPCQFWLSNPSSIDGCFWKDFDEFCQTVKHPLVEIWVDLTYVGATPSAFHSVMPRILDDNIAGVVFSLSKPAGMYYRRVGGCFSRRPISGLYGNMWFKNIDSIYLGQAFLKESPRGHIPDKYEIYQKKTLSVLNEFREKNDETSLWLPSEVVLLAHANSRPFLETKEDDPDRFRRAPGFYRACLTPALYKQIVEGV